MKMTATSNLLDKVIQKPESLAHVLNIELSQLKQVHDNIEQYYTEYEEIKRHPDGSPKLNNGEPETRVFNPSHDDLKYVQKRIKKVIFDDITYPDYVMGGVKGKSNIDNALQHLGKKHHFVTDISSFFPSIDNDMVYEMFVELFHSADVAHYLTRLTTYKHRVPQGAPTSTDIANLVFRPYDIRINEICSKYDITYTRFVDDLVFSSPYNFKQVVDEILEPIRDSSFEISHRKTFYKIGPVEVTGIVARNNLLKATDKTMGKLNENYSEETRTGVRQYLEQISEKMGSRNN